jgi:alpha-glucosidase
MYIRPLAFDFPEDEKVKDIEDQLLVGQSIMIAPIVHKDTTRRTVYLPEDMTVVRYDGKDFTCQPAAKGELEIEVQLHEAVFFIRKGQLLPVGKPAVNSREVSCEDLKLLGDGDVYELYWDDGMTRDCTVENITVLKKGNSEDA